MAKGVGPSEGCFNVLCTGAEGAGTGNSKSRGRSAGEAETECWWESIYAPRVMHLSLSKYLNIPEQQDGAHTVCLNPGYNANVS